MLAGLAKLRNRQCHREPLTKPPGEGLFELRHVGKLNTRGLWFLMKGRRIIAVHGIRNKGQAAAARDIARKLQTTQQQISKLESPDYEAHSLSMLRRAAKALRARVRVVLEPDSADKTNALPEEAVSYRYKRPTKPA